MVRVIALLGLFASGCYATFTGGFYPSPNVQVAEVPAADVNELGVPNAPLTHYDAIPAVQSHKPYFTIGVSLGFYLDFFGVGVGFGWGGNQYHKPIEPLPRENPQFWRIRADGDLPLYLVEDLIKTRVTLMYEHTNVMTVGSGTTTGVGNTFYGGATISTIMFLKFMSLSFSLGGAYTHQEAGAFLPEVRRDSPAWTLDAGGVQGHLMVTFLPIFLLPEGATSGQVAQPSKDTGCTQHVSRTCSYGPFGYGCSDSTSCY